jgi:tellurite resistance protein TehA-like permease
LTKLHRLSSIVQELSPSYFSIVMATGIISIAADLIGFSVIPEALLWLNVAFYVLLWLFTITRIVFYSGRFLEDLSDFNRGVGYLTTVAATCILGSQFVILDKAYQLGFVFLCAACFLWGLLIYWLFTALMVRSDKPAIEAGINGAWLLTTVSAQSLSVLAGRLANQFLSCRESILFFSLGMFLVGCALYLILITLIFYRLMFKELLPERFSPTYWINMGALAISALAGTILAQNVHDQRILSPFAPFVNGLTIMCWSMATWWIPILLVLTLWRRIHGRVRLSYSPEYWSLVFPVGMYTACTVTFSETFQLYFLLVIPHYFIYLAFAAWLMTFFGLIKFISNFLFNDGVVNASEENNIK